MQQQNAFYLIYTTNKTKQFNFKKWCVIWMANGGSSNELCCQLQVTIFKRIAKIKFVMFFIAYPIILLTA